MTGCRLLRSPGELPAMVVALATGVGLTVAAYSLIHAVLIRPLPYSEPERLVQIWDFDPQLPDRRPLRDRDVDVLAEAPSVFQGVASHAPLERDLLPGPGMTPFQRAARPAPGQSTGGRLPMARCVSAAVADESQREAGTVRLQLVQ